MLKIFNYSSKKHVTRRNVKYYFSQFNDKNQSGMNLVLYKKIQGTNADLKNLISVTLNNCVEEKDSSKIEIDDAWYENPYKVAMVYVTFDIKYKGVGGDGLSNSEYKWKYYLVKESEKSDWVIVQWGGG